MSEEKITLILGMEEFKEMDYFMKFISLMKDKGYSDVYSIARIVENMDSEGLCFRSKRERFMESSETRFLSKDKIFEEIKKLRGEESDRYSQDMNRMREEISSLKEKCEVLNQNTFINSKTTKRKKKGWFW